METIGSSRFLVTSGSVEDIFFVLLDALQGFGSIYAYIYNVYRVI